MKSRLYILLLSALLASACSTTRVLQKDEYRLAKNKLTIKDKSDLTPGSLSPYIRQEANGSGIFGWNPFVVAYNFSRKDGFWHKIGQAPVVYDKHAVGASIENITTRLEYLGYYNSAVDTVTTVRKRCITVNYQVHLGKQYPVTSISYELPDDPVFREEFYADSTNVQKLLAGAPLSEQALEAETVRGAAYFRDLGYFSFNKGFYTFEADTLGGEARLQYRINNYSRNDSPDKAGAIEKYKFGKVNISWPASLKFRQRVLRGLNTIRPGELYSATTVNTAYTRLSSLRVFSGVAIEMNPQENNTVDANIKLTPGSQQGFKVNMEASTNSSGLIGISPKLNYFHKNIFHGGEWLNIGFSGNFQFKPDDDTRATEYGINAGLSFPRFLGLPYRAFRRANIPRTEINGSFSYQNRPEYTRSIVSTGFGYSGRMSHGRISYQIYPLQLNFVRLFNLDEAFSANLDNNPYMRYSFQDHLDAGSGLILYYNSSTDIVPQGSYRFHRLAVDLSGNVLSAFKGSMPKDKDGAAMLFGSPFAQYARAEYSFGKTWRYGLHEETAVATRFLIGGGYAYGNSSALPFEKQFYAGGASSMRGWQARALGPGTAQPNKSFIIPSQTGDFKLEANVEYRFDLFWKLEGALFADLGNVWTLQNDDVSSDGAFSLKTFYKSLGADWGLGLRVNLEFILLRLDWGIKLYDPVLDEGSRLVGPQDWLRRGGSSLHFGIGYPF